MTEAIGSRNYNLIGKNIRRLREEQQLTARKLIVDLQFSGLTITEGTLSKVEQGKSSPSVELLCVLKEQFHCDFSDFFKGYQAVIKDLELYGD